MAVDEIKIQRLSFKAIAVAIQGRQLSANRGTPRFILRHPLVTIRCFHVDRGGLGPVVEEPVVEAAAANTATEKPEAGDGEEEKENNPKKAKAKKAAAPRKPRKPQSHPPYLEMIGAAITTLKDRTGSSQLAIAKYIEDKYKGHLPPNFRKVLFVQLKKLTVSGKLTKVKNSYKLPHVPASRPKSSKTNGPKKPHLPPLA
ncbi:hypothetical protein HPP92_009421 [Vanilla planifolia]|uniref:H15 domain-containing protein n=1 Tax=Vanilla planifolia TaxID=51239 RepID=A0A835R7T0_VANPL|nr:hypothetical protein HPP92_009421 [Vanilla planifolia]